MIASAVRARLRKTTHKFGIEVPRTVEEAYALDKKNGNDYWSKAITKEMTNVGIAFEVIEDDAKMPVGWVKVTGHMIFDVKMDFTRKARFVLDDPKTTDPIGSIYAGGVSHESIRIAFTSAALNGLDVFARDIQNAYLQAPSSQIICVAGLFSSTELSMVERL